MTKGIAVLTVRGADYPPTRRLIEAARPRNVRVVPIHPYHVLPGYNLGRPIVHGLPADLSLKAVLPRQGAEIKSACLPLIAHFEHMGICVINGLSSILIVRNKFLSLQALSAAGLPVPETFFAASVQGCAQARQRLSPQPAVLKPVSGRQGAGLHLLQPRASLPRDFVDALEAGRGVLIQEFVSPSQRRDIRAFVVGGKVEATVALTPLPGDFRANFHAGARAAAVKVSAQLEELAVAAAQALGLEIAGVDLMVLPDGRAMVVEANYAPGFRGLEAATGMDIAGLILDYVLGRIAA
jgi:ribosomal protein S6--L-glutamate ligase